MRMVCFTVRTYAIRNVVLCFAQNMLFERLAKGCDYSILI